MKIFLSCSDDNYCIPGHKRCDNIINCNSMGDEIGCLAMAPQDEPVPAGNVGSPHSKGLLNFMVI